MTITPQIVKFPSSDGKNTVYGEIYMPKTEEVKSIEAKTEEVKCKEVKEEAKGESTAPKKSMESEPDLLAVKTLEKITGKNEEDDVYVNLGREMPYYLL